MLNDNKLDSFITHYCVDINKDALEVTKNLLIEYKLDQMSEVVNSNLFEYFTDEKKINFDIIFLLNHLSY